MQPTLHVITKFKIYTASFELLILNLEYSLKAAHDSMYNKLKIPLKFCGYLM